MPKGTHWLILGTLLTVTLFAFSQPPQSADTHTTEGWIISFLFQQTPTPTLVGGGSSGGGFALIVPLQRPIPSNQDEGRWQAASGTLNIATSGTEPRVTVNFAAQGLVAYGLYSLWWVIPADSLSVEQSIRMMVFRADEAGAVTTQFTIPAGEDYAKFGVAVIYHESGMLIGDAWGKLGTDSYLHLSSPNVATLGS